MRVTRNGDHIPFDALVDYWCDECGDSPLDDHLLGCDVCCGRLGWLAALSDAIPDAVRSGGAMIVMTPAVLGRLAAGGLRIREYRLAAGGSVNCTITPADDLVVAHLAAPLAGLRRVDLVATAGGVAHRIDDVPFDAASGEIVVAPRARDLRALGVATESARLIAVDTGGERVIGEYTFHHRPFGAPA